MGMLYLQITLITFFISHVRSQGNRIGPVCPCVCAWRVQLFDVQPRPTCVLLGGNELHAPSQRGKEDCALWNVGGTWMLGHFHWCCSEHEAPIQAISGMQQLCSSGNTHYWSGGQKKLQKYIHSLPGTASWNNSHLIYTIFISSGWNSEYYYRFHKVISTVLEKCKK